MPVTVILCTMTGSWLSLIYICIGTRTFIASQSKALEAMWDVCKSLLQSKCSKMHRFAYKFSRVTLPNPFAARGDPPRPIPTQP